MESFRWKQTWPPLAAAGHVNSNFPHPLSLPHFFSSLTTSLSLHVMVRGLGDSEPLSRVPGPGIPDISAQMDFFHREHVNH